MRRFIGKMPEVVRARSVYGGAKLLNGEAIIAIQNNRTPAARRPDD